MDLEVDRNKLKIKHYLNIQTETSEYPTEEDYLYELTTFIVDTELGFENSFNVTWAKHRICPNMDLDFHVKTLEKLEKLGYIEEDKSVNRKVPSYKFKTHPWIKTKK